MTGMEERTVFADHRYGNETHKVEEDEEEFKSCYEDEDELKDGEERPRMDSKGSFSLDDDHAIMYFKGVSVAGPGESGSRISGIGVVIERPGNPSALLLQKKLDFYVDEMVAEYLAFLDGLSLAIQNDVQQICILTDSEVFHNQIMNDELIESPLMEALRQRVLEQVTDLETFALNLVPASKLEKALSLARVAVGLVSAPADGDESAEICSLCRKERLTSMMATIKCGHNFCSYCMNTHVERKLQSAKLPVRCPQSGCRHCISVSECRSFLTVVSCEALEKALVEADVMSCPYSSCSAVIEPFEFWSNGASFLTGFASSCLECRVCQQSICLNCKLPWHSSMSCEEYQRIPEDQRAAAAAASVPNKRWRCCQHCRGVVMLANGSYHMRCCCGHEFCYACGAEYRDGHQTCHCPLWDVNYSSDVAPYSPRSLEQWAWDSFESLPMMMDVYSDQERSQLALIQGFLAGGFGMSDHDTAQAHQAPPRCTDSYAETMKDLHQLPWLERFVSVITDNYYESYVQ